MIPANVGRFRYLGERKFFGRMFLDELSRFPDLYRFGPMAIARRLGNRSVTTGIIVPYPATARVVRLFFYCQCLV